MYTLDRKIQWEVYWYYILRRWSRDGGEESGPFWWWVCVGGGEPRPATPPYASASSGLIKNSLLCLVKFGALEDFRIFFLSLDLCLFTVAESP